MNDNAGRTRQRFDFERGKVYVRQELLERYGGQRQSGIATPKDYPLIFLFTGETGTEHGYGFDGWKESNVFHYTGEGQRGDMTFSKGNKAIRDHEQNDERIFLFEQLPNRPSTRGRVRLIGEMRYSGHRIEPRDTTGVAREVIVFELMLVGE